MDAVIQFMQSAVGRTTRIILGIILLALGLFVMGGIWGIIVAILGLLPLVGGAFGICLLAPLVGYTLTGHKRAGSVSS
jgi:predicted PurR-regulated permease PerM